MGRSTKSVTGVASTIVLVSSYLAKGLFRSPRCDHNHCPPVVMPLVISELFSANYTSICYGNRYTEATTLPSKALLC